MLTKEYLGYRQKHNNVIKVWSLIQSLIDIKSALNNEFHKGKEKIEREKKLPSQKDLRQANLFSFILA